MQTPSARRSLDSGTVVADDTAPFRSSTMRLRIAIAFALLALPASAAGSIADQAQQAFATFAGGKAQVDFEGGRYGAVALKDVAGNWVSLNGPAAGTGIETYGTDTEAFCKGTGILRLAAPDPITMTLSAKPVDSEFTQIYTMITGATFSEYTDPATYFAAIGLGPDKSGAQAEQARALALSLANGIVQIYRPSADILVITRERGYPTILARCPTL